MNCKGFTLLEILIVVSILGILLCVAIPNIQRARLQAEEAKIQAELSSLAKSIMGYYVFENEFPTCWEDLKNYLDINYYQKYYKFEE